MLAALLGLFGSAAGQGVVDPERGIVGVASAVRGLGGVKRVLIIGAHPDDEDTALLTWLVRGQGADAAYLALNRGEGGQNLIGPELGVGLGLLRTGELLAARELDGARQYFTRAYDFGYSKTAEETFRFWPRDSLLADVVAVVRQFRPQVIVSIFSGTPRDGHGHHQAAGALAREAFSAAGDTRRFPEQLAQGMRAWTPLKLYRSTRFDRDASTIEIETGALDPVYGRSYHQIAMASRSRHRSQDMGRVEALGPQTTSLQLLENRATPGDSTGETSLFDGIDTTFAGMLGELDAGAERDAVARAVAAYVERLERARAALGGWQTEIVVAELAAALERLRRARARAEQIGASADELRFVLAAEEQRLESALAAAAGVVVEAFADDDLVVPGEEVEIEVQIWNGGARAVEVRRVTLATPGVTQDATAGALPPATLTRRRFRVAIPEGAEYSIPEYLRGGSDGAMYAWPAGTGERGAPLGEPVAKAEVEIGIAGQAVLREIEVVHRFADQARGEVRKPVFVVPAVGLAVEPKTTVWPLGRAGGMSFRVNLRGEAAEGVSGLLHLELPAGWSATPSEAAFVLEAAGSAATVDFTVTPPPGLEAASYVIAAVAVTPDGQGWRQGYSLVDYPHVRRALFFDDALARVEAFDLVVEGGLRVGYVPGAGDAVAEAIAALGVEVDVLDGAAVAAGDLSKYDAIVLGIRAYETNTALVANNGRLLDWVRAGGTLISQYQQYAYFNGAYAPYPLSARRPHDRVSDEAAPVTILAPDHQLFNRPNRIGAADFEGWVQERGLYFPFQWDDRYLPLLESADPGEEPKRGALLVARFGDGMYVYTGLALFRQLPAGVPGAYRLLANLLGFAP